MHVLTHTHTDTQTYKHKHTHRRTNTQTQTQTQAQAHTYTQLYNLVSNRRRVWDDEGTSAVPVSVTVFHPRKVNGCDFVNPFAEWKFR